MERPRTFQARRPVASNRAPDDASQRLKGTMALLGAGLAILSFLIAIDRSQWFHIRPATGTSIALSNAMDGKLLPKDKQQARTAKHP